MPTSTFFRLRKRNKGSQKDMGYKKAVEPLTKALRNKFISVREVAKDALEKIKVK